MRGLLKLFYFFGILGLLLTVGANAWVVYSTKGQVLHAIDSLTETDMVLVLGTSKRTTAGQANPYFENRMKAAVELYQSGKVKQFVVSGHNPSRYYDEPRDMKSALIDAGVPSEAIVEDTAGYRTYQSMVRFLELHPNKSVTIITQEFHSYRALFIANHLGIPAQGYPANNTTISRSFDVLLREYFARVKAVGEVFTQPPQSDS